PVAPGWVVAAVVVYRLGVVREEHPFHDDARNRFELLNAWLKLPLLRLEHQHSLGEGAVLARLELLHQFVEVAAGEIPLIGRKPPSLERLVEADEALLFKLFGVMRLTGPTEADEANGRWRRCMFVSAPPGEPAHPAVRDLGRSAQSAQRRERN